MYNDTITLLSLFTHKDTTLMYVIKTLVDKNMKSLAIASCISMHKPICMHNYICTEVYTCVPKYVNGTQFGMYVHTIKATMYFLSLLVTM